MSNAYEIIKYDCDNYACIVVPTAVSNPLEQINVLVEQLKKHQIKTGRVLFDFIISSGNTKERYASVQYDDGFLYNSFEYVDVKADDPIRKLTADFLRMKIESREVPMLSSLQVSLLKKGYTL